MIQKPDRAWFAIGRLHSVDFTEGLIELAVDGDIAPVCPGTYVMIPAEEYRSLKRLADAARHVA